MSNYVYEDAFVVWETLWTIDQSIDLERAVTLRFNLVGESNSSLKAENRALLLELDADELIKLYKIQDHINHYRSIEKHQVEWTQQVAALTARLRTLEMRARNIEQDLAKGGFFRGKRQKELQLESERLSDKILQVRNEVHMLDSKLEEIERSRRSLGQEVNTHEDFREARWVLDESALSGGVVVSLTHEGRFLLNYLSEMKPAAIRERTLPQALVYGIAWSMGV